MAISFTWLGHSAFLVQVDDTRILIDPFLSGNPLGATDAGSVDADFILVTHGHGDHVGDTVAIAKRTGAPVLANVEVANWIANQGVENTVGFNTGGTYDAGPFRAKLTIAFHSSSLPDGSYGGQPNGFIIKTDEGKNLYFAGDTALFSDMQLIGDEEIELAFLPIGDFFTMGIDDSIKAINFIRPRLVTPMHYNTFPPISCDVTTWAKRVNTETQAIPIVLDPGGEHHID